jgi:hypothetical protein
VPPLELTQVLGGMIWRGRKAEARDVDRLSTDACRPRAQTP